MDPARPRKACGRKSCLLTRQAAPAAGISSAPFRQNSVGQTQSMRSAMILPPGQRRRPRRKGPVTGSKGPIPPGTPMSAAFRRCPFRSGCRGGYPAPAGRPRFPGHGPGPPPAKGPDPTSAAPHPAECCACTRGMGGIVRGPSLWPRPFTAMPRRVSPAILPVITSCPRVRAGGHIRYRADASAGRPASGPDATADGPWRAGSRQPGGHDPDRHHGCPRHR